MRTADHSFSGIPPGVCVCLNKRWPRPVLGCCAPEKNIGAAAFMWCKLQRSTIQPLYSSFVYILHSLNGPSSIFIFLCECFLINNPTLRCLVMEFLWYTKPWNILKLVLIIWCSNYIINLYLFVLSPVFNECPLQHFSSWQHCWKTLLLLLLVVVVIIIIMVVVIAVAIIIIVVVVAVVVVVVSSSSTSHTPSYV